MIETGVAEGRRRKSLTVVGKFAGANAIASRLPGMVDGYHRRAGNIHLIKRR